MTHNSNLPSTIKIAIIEDQPEMRESLVTWLGDTPGLRCVGAYASGEEALKAIPAENPDVVLMDITLGGMTGIECVSRLKAKHAKMQFLMLTTYEEPELIFNSLRAGASGYLLKNMPQSELVEAVRQVHGGGAAMPPSIARKVISYFQQVEKPVSGLEQLTSREKEILKLLAKGYMYKEIADQLAIGIGTVRTHICAIYEKLHVHSRTEAAMKLYGKS